MNVPNNISLFRLFLIPVIVMMEIFPFAQFGISIPIMKIGFVTLSYQNIAILVLFVVASISDFLDGYIARKTNQVTTLGKFLDPIADKALTTTMFVIFAVKGILPILVVLIMIWRDIIVDCVRMLAAEKGMVISAGMMGKGKTVAQMLCIIMILLNNLPFALWYIPVADILVWLATTLSVLSGLSYVLQAKDLILESK